MLIRILSDLHNEFGQFKTTFSENDINVLAGDINFDANQLSNIPNLVYVAGNHEFYGKNIDNKPKFAKEKEVVEIEGLKFFCTTLWSDLSTCNPMEEIAIQCWMNDFKRIKGLTWELWERMFGESYSWLMDQDLEGQVVVTHHAPSFKSIHPIYMQGSSASFNKAFASDLDELILEKKPALWIHGHTHTSFNYKIGDTRVICNPYGYFGYEVNPEFNEHFMVGIQE